ncbi:Rqc2 family fibronectin-binding protein [Herpetosiphon llansteffanensis]|uniref:Rqc2 family fibronectin-binding protein n=1 Tax=Herpetosiphon llansteffanensis TaxID=2094568 RepID=UPI000D7B952C|nr:NFACT RNA binding domain-containing protein [Herpetosiphon llansteffanensis]
MHIDALVVAAIVAELQILVGGKIQQVVLPNPDSVGFEVYADGQRHQLLLSANPKFARLHTVPTKLTRDPNADSPLLLLLRKYVRGGRITKIESAPLERVISLSIAKMPIPRKELEPDEDDDDEVMLTPRYSELVLEIIGHSSNLILVDDNGLVLESIRHYNPQRSQRPIMPRSMYEGPPSQGKNDPRTATAAAIAALGGDLAKALVTEYSGVSPQTGREIAWRATGATSVEISPALDFESIANQLRELTSLATIEPTLARNAEGKPIGIAAFGLQHQAHSEAYPSMNEALATAFAELDQVTAHAQRRDALLERVAEAQRRAKTKADQLRTQLARVEQLEQLRWEGEMIFGYIYAIKPGQSELLLDQGVITLDPKLSAVENAQARFREYDKAKGALEDVPQLLEQTEAQAEYLQQTNDLLSLAESFAEIEQFERELIAGGWLRQTIGKAKSKPNSSVGRGPLRVISPDGWTIFVGRSADQNDEVTFKLGQPEDYWLHARERTGGHVIIRMQAATVPPRTLEQAAQLAAYYSSARNDGAVEVDISLRKHVRKIKGGPPGLVRYTAERTLRVEPKKEQKKA